MILVIDSNCLSSKACHDYTKFMLHINRFNFIKFFTKGIKHFNILAGVPINMSNIFFIVEELEYFNLRLYGER